MKAVPPQDTRRAPRRRHRAAGCAGRSARSVTASMRRANSSSMRPVGGIAAITASLPHTSRQIVTAVSLFKITLLQLCVGA